VSKKTLGFAAFVLASLAVASPAKAVITFNDSVTGDVIFGSGNDNGAFTVDRRNGIEVGLRAKLRFDALGNPQNIFNSNGDGTYTFNAGQAVGGFSFAQPPTTTPVWNFEWSINSDYLGSEARSLSELEYLISIDFDPSGGTNFLSFDPINLAFADHAIGDNSTVNGNGTVAANAPQYASLIASNNLAQNSWNYEFFNNGPYAGFDPETVGVYTIVLEALSDDVQIASTEIRIIVEKAVAVPEPASGLLFLVGLAGLGVLHRRRATT
jgi:PEP-CTERM motif-containing protein